jgi:hypothetical protein
MSTAPTAKSVTNAKGTTYLLPPPSKSDAPSRTLGQRNGDLIPAYAIGGVRPKQLPRTPYWRSSRGSLLPRSKGLGAVVPWCTSYGYYGEIR